MARHGIEGADLNRINVAAGQRNSSAIHYHFGSRRGLVEAIYANHREPINDERNAILDRLERRDAVTLEALVGAMVLPVARHLDDPSRRDYVIIVAEGSTRLGTTGLYLADQPHSDGLRRLNAHLARVVDGTRASRSLRIGQANLVAIVLLADIAREISHEQLSIAHGRRRVRGVIETVHGGLSGPRTAGRR